MSAQDPGLDILHALLRGSQPPPPPPPPPPPGQTTPDVAVADSQGQARFVGGLRPEAQSSWDRPELCWSFWLKGWALTEDASPQQPYNGRSGTVEGIPEEDIKTYLQRAFGSYIEWAAQKGYFPAVQGWEEDAASIRAHVESMTNPYMLKITLKRDSVTLDPQMALGASATKVSIRWRGTEELYDWNTPTNDSNAAWIFLPMIEMFNRMINNVDVASKRDPIREMQRVNEVMFGLEIGSLRMTSYNFPIVVGERPFDPHDSYADIASFGSLMAMSEREYETWHCAMKPTAMHTNVYDNAITISKFEDHYEWKESSAERYIQWGMLCKNMVTPTMRIGNLGSAAHRPGPITAPNEFYTALRSNLRGYLHHLQSETFRLIQPRLTAATVNRLATSIVDYWASSENLELWVEKALLEFADTNEGEAPVMRVCVKWRLPKNVAIDVMHDLRHDIVNEPRDPESVELHLKNDVTKLAFCRIPAAELPNYSKQRRVKWQPRIADVPFRRSEFDSWRESIFWD